MKGSLWLALSRMLVNALGGLSTVVLARVLMPADFGIFAIAVGITSIVTAVTDISMTQTLIQRDVVEDVHIHSAWTLSVLRGALIAVLLAAAAYPMALLFKEPRLTAVMLVVGLNFLVNGLTSPKLAMLQRQLVFRQEVFYAVSQKGSAVLTTIILALIFRSYWALVAGMVVGQAVSVVVSYALAPYRPRATISHARELFSFAGWLTMGQVVDTLNWRIDTLLIGKFLNTSEVGLYSVGSTLAMLPTREALEPLTRTLFAGLSKLAADVARPDRLRAGYQRAQALVTAVSLPVGIGTGLLADPLVRLFMGERWVPIIFILQVLSLIFAVQTIGTQVRPLAMAMGQTRQLFWRSIQLLVIRLPIVICGLWFYGLRGMVVARVLAGFVSIFINMRQVRQLIGVSIIQQLASNLRAIASVVIMAAAVLLVDAAMPADHTSLMLGMRIATLSLTGAISYVGASWLLWSAMGKPSGPETELTNMLGQFLRRRKRPELGIG